MHAAALARASGFTGRLGLIGGNVFFGKSTNEEQECVNPRKNAGNPEQCPKNVDVHEPVNQQPIDEHERDWANDAQCKHGHQPLALKGANTPTRSAPKQHFDAFAI